MLSNNNGRPRTFLCRGDSAMVARKRPAAKRRVLLSAKKTNSRAESLCYCSLRSLVEPTNKYVLHTPHSRRNWFALIHYEDWSDAEHA